MLAGKDDVLLWLFEKIIGEAAEYIGRQYFGPIGTLIAMLVVGFVFGASTKRTEQAPPTDEPAPLALQGDGPLARAITNVLKFVFLAIASVPIGFVGGIVWSILGRIVPAVDALGGERGPAIASMIVAVSALAWFYRSSWKNPIVGLASILVAVLLLRFNVAPEPFVWLSAAVVGVGASALVWIYGLSWQAASIRACAVGLGAYLLGHEVPLGPVGILLCVGAAFGLTYASPELTDQR